MNTQSSSERMIEAMEHVLRHWQTEITAEPPAHEEPTGPPDYIIAISREAGTEGPKIARAVGARLDWPVYDREIVQKIAEEMKLRTSLVESVDEKRRGWLRECLDAFFTGSHVNQGAYVRHLVETLLSVAGHGKAVILGRGAAQILPEATTLRVRLVAPLQARIEVIRQRFGIAHDAAAQWVERTDQERALFVRDYFRKDPSDPRLYDLVLNTLRFSDRECAEIIVQALRRFQERPRAASSRVPAVAHA